MLLKLQCWSALIEFPEFQFSMHYVHSMCLVTHLSSATSITELYFQGVFAAWNKKSKCQKSVWATEALRCVTYKSICLQQAPLISFSYKQWNTSHAQALWWLIGAEHVADVLFSAGRPAVFFHVSRQGCSSVCAERTQQCPCFCHQPAGCASHVPSGWM